MVSFSCDVGSSSPSRSLFFPRLGSLSLRHRVLFPDSCPSMALAVHHASHPHALAPAHPHTALPHTHTPFTHTSPLHHTLISTLPSPAYSRPLDITHPTRLAPTPAPFGRGASPMSFPCPVPSPRPQIPWAPPAASLVIWPPLLLSRGAQIPNTSLPLLPCGHLNLTRSYLDRPAATS